jgi:hypothetical protein
VDEPDDGDQNEHDDDIKQKFLVTEPDCDGRGSDEIQARKSGYGQYVGIELHEFPPRFAA